MQIVQLNHVRPKRFVRRIIRRVASVDANLRSVSRAKSVCA
jgi:hypothetical protein